MRLAENSAHDDAHDDLEHFHKAKNTIAVKLGQPAKDE